VKLIYVIINLNIEIKLGWIFYSYFQREISTDTTILNSQ